MCCTGPWSGTTCCDDSSAGPPPPDYDGPTILATPQTPVMRKYRFVVGPTVDGSNDVTSGHVYDSPLIREPADMTSFVGNNVAIETL